MNMHKEVSAEQASSKEREVRLCTVEVSICIVDTFEVIKKLKKEHVKDSPVRFTHAPEHKRKGEFPETVVLIYEGVPYKLNLCCSIVSSCNNIAKSVSASCTPYKK